MNRLSDMIRKLEIYFAEQEQIIASYLFGSFARGTQHRDSDVDIAILLDERNGKIDRKSLLDRLLPELGRLLRRDVHILVLNDAPYLIRIEALSGGQLIFVKDQVTLAKFRMSSFALFADYAPTMRGLQEKFRKQLRERHGQ